MPYALLSCVAVEPMWMPSGVFAPAKKKTAAKRFLKKMTYPRIEPALMFAWSQFGDGWTL